MTWIVAALLLLSWIVTVVGDRTLGGATHGLLAVALVLLGLGVFRLRHKPVK